MTIHELVELITVIVTVGNAVALVYLSLKKLTPEVKKMSVDTDSEIVDAANMNLEGAKVSAQMLLDRINELRTDLEREKTARKEDQIMNEKFRRDDAEYFRRRIKDMEKETRDLRSWIARLVKQVVELGATPAPYIPSISDSDPSIPPLPRDCDTSR